MSENLPVHELSHRVSFATGRLLRALINLCSGSATSCDGVWYTHPAVINRIEVRAVGGSCEFGSFTTKQLGFIDEHDEPVCALSC